MSRISVKWLIEKKWINELIREWGKMKEERVRRIRKSMDNQLIEKGFVTVVDTFIDIGILDKSNYEKWKKLQVSYLEQICKGNLNKLSEIIREIYKYSKELNLKESFTFYKKYGKGKEKLRFSKSGQDNIEKRYATHFIINIE